MSSLPIRRRTVSRPICVVVADHGGARFLTAATPRAALVEHTALQNPAFRLREHELDADQSGNLATPSHAGGHATDERDATRRHLADEFARRVCAELRSERLGQRYLRIHLVAQPNFLGLLRRHLDRPTQRLVASQIGKDMVRRQLADIRRLLPERL
ncbi:host attachment protein [Solimonas soli]|uniref:host attachment protein n=1 Tax=Solimonas soli TaxID=413479 RepID=UPI000485AB28|nr:host attachment protein [Solimonas soli]